MIAKATCNKYSFSFLKQISGYAIVTNCYFARKSSLVIVSNAKGFPFLLQSRMKVNYDIHVHTLKYLFRHASTKSAQSYL